MRHTWPVRNILKQTKVWNFAHLPDFHVCVKHTHRPKLENASCRAWKPKFFIKIHFHWEWRVFVVWCSNETHLKDFCLYFSSTINFLKKSRFFVNKIASSHFTQRNEMPEIREKCWSGVLFLSTESEVSVGWDLLLMTSFFQTPRRQVIFARQKPSTTSKMFSLNSTNRKQSLRLLRTFLHSGFILTTSS